MEKRVKKSEKEFWRLKNKNFYLIKSKHISLLYKLKYYNPNKLLKIQKLYYNDKLWLVKICKDL